MAYTSYNAILSVTTTTSSTPTEYFKELQQYINNDMFDMTSDYKVVKVKDRTTGLYSDLGVRVVPQHKKGLTSINDDVKEIIFKQIDYAIKLGDIFEFDNFRWMVLDTNSKSTMQSYCRIQRCNTQLRFTEATPTGFNTIVIDAIAENKIGGNDNSPVIILPVGVLNVKVPNDSNSKKIRLAPKPTRFLLGNQDWNGKYQNWIVEMIDSISNVKRTIETISSDSDGFLEIRLKLAQSSPKDNHTLQIAHQDYF